jgi:stress response protein YsnF
VAEAPAPYEDGDTLVVPVVEEVLVVEKRLRVREEIRIRRRVATRRETFETDRRKEEVAVERSRKKP